MEGITSGIDDGDRRLNSLGQHRGVNYGCDFGSSVGREVQLVVDQWGGGGEGKTEEAGVGASPKGDDLFLDGG